MDLLILMRSRDVLVDPPQTGPAPLPDQLAHALLLLLLNRADGLVRAHEGGDLDGAGGIRLARLDTRGGGRGARARARDRDGRGGEGGEGWIGYVGGG